ncbi:MAG: hypothetical protein ABIY55_22340 [Kofleriaceae bacterium]
MKWLIVIAMVGCGASAPPAGTGSAPASTSMGSASTPCDGARAKVEQLYRAEAQTREPKRVDEAVADNTAMVLRDCAKAPAKVAACIAAIATVADLEAKCLVALDDEGSEGDQLAH